jgi:hypothetical protein
MADFNEIGVSLIGFKAGGTIAKGQPVKMDGTNSKQVVVCDAIADLAVGIAQTSAVAGDYISVQTHGIAQCLAGATITINAPQMVEVTSGRVVDLSGATAKFIGVALQAAADGDIFEVLLGHLPNTPGPTA